MRTKLVAAEELWREVSEHVLRDDDEHLAFILAGYTECSDGHRLTAREVVLIPDEDLDPGHRYGISLTLARLLDVMNRANSSGLALIEVHSHPFGLGPVRFSPIDRRGQREMARYLEDVLTGRPYAALVLGPKGLDGAVWLSGKRASVLDEVQVVSATLAKIWPRAGKRHHANMRRPDVDDRQVLAFGEAGQRAIASSSVGIVGLGGIGSVVANELAHLGVRSFVLVDDDIVEASNLNRLVGANTRDVGAPKVGVARAAIHRTNGRARIVAVEENVRTAAALRELAGVDVLFGCVDTDAGRLIMSELAAAYLTPFIDCGVGITAKDGRVVEGGGRVVVWTPGRPCLRCSKDIHPGIAAEELESEEERAFRRQHGYITGATVPEPAVISLNATVASLAVTEFIALITHLRATQHYTYYDLLEQRVGPRIVTRQPGCVVCALEGLGGGAKLERYSRVGLPRDLPHAGQERAIP